MSRPPPRETEPCRADRARAVLVPGVLLALAAVLGLGPWKFESPVTRATFAPAWASDPTPVRRVRLTPEIEVAGFTYRCSDCHRHIPSPPETTRTLTQHQHIRLDHGLNARCFNCHHPTERDAFVDDAGGAIPYDQPQLVCAKCHGPVYRDWLHGAHGRTNGHWDPQHGPQTRRRCIECHDPHVPPFPPLTPAPGPNTLRMGPQDEAAHEDGHDPLRVHGRAGAAPSGEEGQP